MQQRKSCLSVRTPFDPFHFVDEAFDHAIVAGLTASIGDSLCIVGKPIYKADQFRDATGLNS